jgi:hypothetical protein
MAVTPTSVFFTDFELLGAFEGDGAHYHKYIEK